MKNILFAFCLLLPVLLYAQETMEVRSRLTKNITEVYHVLVSNQRIKEGLYQAIHGKKMALASGIYKDDKKAGVWHYFDYDGKLAQNFDYNRNMLTYEAPEDDPSSFKYLFDNKVNSADTITKPIKIGGRFFGYVPLLAFFKKPDDMPVYGTSPIFTTVELLVSPAGNLADYTIHLGYRDLNVNLNLLKQEDKLFLPATINGSAVASRIVIKCYIDLNGNLTIN